jgi:hypothetical protein
MEQTPRIDAPRNSARPLSADEEHEHIQSYLRRHPVSRRAALRAASFGAGALAATRFARASAAMAAPVAAPARAIAPGSFGLRFAGRHLSYGPDPATQMWAAVQTSGLPPGPIVLEYGADYGFGGTAEVMVRNLVTQFPETGGSIYTAEQYYLHGLISGLQPGTSYPYRFRLADGTVTPTAVLTTAPAPFSLAPFHFTAIADEGINWTYPHGLNEPSPFPGELTSPTNWTDNYYASNDTRRSAKPAQTLVDLITAQQPAFNIVAGDLCYASNTGFDPYVWDDYFIMLDKAASTFPWMFTVGNHEIETPYTNPPNATVDYDLNYEPHGYGGLFYRIDFGYNGPLADGTPNLDPAVRGVAPNVYSFRYQNVAVVSLDANDWSYEVTTDLGYTNGAQATWLDIILSRYRQDPTIDFIVLQYHECAYCSGTTHSSDGGVRQVVDPLCSKYAVDLVFQGHNHQYERTDPIRNGQPTREAPIGSTVYPETDGTTYIVVGSGGRPRYGFSAPESFEGNVNNVPTVTDFVWQANGSTVTETVTWSRVRYDDYAFCRIDVTPAFPGSQTTMAITTYSDLNEAVDQVTIQRTAGQSRFY